jgi:putative PEP-CTERM system TPR-repeat lipoprotein
MTRLRQSLFTGVALFFTCSAAHAAGYTAHGEQLLAAGKPREAVIELQNAVQNNPSNGHAHFLLAKLDLQIGDAVSAEREAKAAEAHGYQPNKSFTLLLDSYMAQGRYVDLLHEFTRGAATGSRGARIEVGRGNAELALNRNDRAARDFSKARSLDPKLNLALFGLEDIALAQHDLNSAQNNLDQALALDPTSNEGLLRKARLMLAKGEVKPAITLLKNLVKSSPSNISDQLLLAQALLGVNQTDAARVQIAHVLAIVPNSVEAIYLTAALDVSAHNWHSAQKTLQRISPMMPNLPGAYFLDAVTLENLGQLNAAQQAVQHYVAREPGDLRGQRLLADLDIRIGHPHEALRQLKSLPPAQQKDLAIQMLYGIAHRKTGNLAAAKNDFVQAIAVAPKLPAPHIALAAILIAQGDTHGAVVALQQAAVLAPNNPPVERLLMQAAIAAGEDQTASTALKSLRAAEGPDAEPALAGQLDLAQYKLKDAKAEYRTVQNADPTADAPRLALARIAALQGDQKEEITLLHKVIAHDPANTEAVGMLSSLMVSKGKLDAASVIIEAAHHAAPKNLNFITDMVKLDLLAKKPHAAETLLTGVEPSLMENPQIMAARAQVDLAQGKQQAARDILKAITTKLPGATGPVLALAHLEVAAKNNAAAKAAIQSSLSRNPHNSALMQALTGIEFRSHGLEPALTEAAKLASNPDHLPEAQALPGDLYLAAHQPAKAAVAFGKAYEVSPSPALLGSLVAALNASGQKAEAEAKLRSAIAVHPKSPLLDDMLAQEEIANGKLDDAKTQLQAALAVDPNDGGALNNLAWIDQKQGSPDAEKLAAHAYFVAPLPQMADTLGWILYHQSNNKQALVLLRQAHQGMPGDPSVAYHYAAALAKDGQNTKATSILKPLVVMPDQFADKDAAKILLARLK